MTTRFKVTEDMYQQLLNNPGQDLRINVIPQAGNHPKGYYLIPYDVAIAFIEGKRGTPNWDNHANFHQDSVPVPLRPYFTPVP